MKFKESTFNLANKFGLGLEAIELWDKIFNDKIDLEIAENFSNQQYQQTKGTVLFPIIPGFQTLCQRFGLISYLFKKRGYKPLFIYNNDSLLLKPEDTVDVDNSELTSTVNRYRIEHYSNAFGIESVELSDVIEPDRSQEPLPANPRSIKYRGISISDYAMASTRKYLKQYSINLSDEFHSSVYKKSISDAKYMTDVISRLVDVRDIEYALVNEPYYVQGGVPSAVCSKHSIQVYSQMLGKIDASIIFGGKSERFMDPGFTKKSKVESYLDGELTKQNKKNIEKIMKKRSTDSLISSNTDVGVDVSADHIVGMFTNLLWDSSLEPGNPLYSDVYNWIYDTLECVQKLDNTHLIVKVHPSEQMQGTHEGVIDWFSQTYDQIPDDVTLLEPDTDVNTYVLLDQINAGIVYSSTVGLEMAYDGIPVITAGNPHYRNFGITFDPDSKSDYTNLVEEINDIECSISRQERAQRYAHMFFISKHIHFPLLREDVDILSKEVVENYGDEIEFAIDQIIEKKEVLKPRTGV